ncbi:MAG: CDP-alcohol phosphatidyltransferase family protein [Candidatus Kapabacteria bacterium]|jgi:cardiolipin synthase|nr:CDP-alcohol phosphatidyltransferase family protein [Candidatus Kapabacteria bacterium]
MKQDKDKILTISNLLSVSRAVMAWPMAIAVLNEDVKWILIICFAAALTDMLDGWAARKYNQVTEWGKIFDPVSDKIFIITFVVVLFSMGKIPIWFIAIVISRDIFILIGGLYLTKKLGYVISSEMSGKLAVTILAFELLGLACGVEFAAGPGLYIAIAALLFSSAHYFVKLYKLLKESRANDIAITN